MLVPVSINQLLNSRVCFNVLQGLLLKERPISICDHIRYLCDKINLKGISIRDCQN